MLVELRIKDFAIIDDLSLSFGPGLNIFTGETGAGKSIIIDAITLILGDRASNDVIRGSKEEAQVEALFDVSDCSVLEGVLEEAGIESSESLVIKRVIQRAGRNKIYVNGSLATLVTLTEVGRRLIDIYGQSEHISLTRPDEHVEVLDSFGDFHDLRASMSEKFRAYLKLKRELDSFVRGTGGTERNTELIVHEINEIADAALKSGMEEELKKEEQRVRNASRIKDAASGAEGGLYSGSGSVVERLGVFLKELKEVECFEPGLSKPVTDIESSLYTLEEASRTLGNIAEGIEADPDALEEINAALDRLGKLKRKYGAASVGEVLEKKAALEAELATIEGFDEKRKELEESVSKAREAAALVSNRLGEQRKKAAVKLEERIISELGGLGMKDSVFEVIVEAEKNPDQSPRLGEKGADRVVFLISTNPGEGVKPLARIASGGELSRIMLAMKSVTAEGRVSTLVFDEIDAGVGGAMAQVVGLKLKEVADSQQVLCITHLAQIAAFADKHFSVSKEGSAEGRTVTAVAELATEARLEEIAVMLGGIKVTDVTRKHAVELVEAARELSAARG